MCRGRFGSREKYKATRRLHTIHSDVCQLSHQARDGSKYFVTFIDDFTKFGVVYFIHAKSQVFECLQHFVSSSERETGEKIVELRSDNGGEYISLRLKVYLRSLGIRHTMGPPHTPQLNGVAERYNRTLLQRMKPLLKDSPYHREFWTEALSYAVWTTNRSPTRTNDGFCTPYELYYGRLPSLKKARTSGAPGNYLIPSADRSKLGDNSRQCRFLGVLPRGDGWRVLDCLTRRVVKTRDAYFNEEAHAEGDIKTPSHPPADEFAPYLDPDTSPSTSPPHHEDEQARLPDQQAVDQDHRPRRQRLQPERYGNLQAHTADADSPTFKQATQSDEASA